MVPMDWSIVRVVFAFVLLAAFFAWCLPRVEKGPTYEPPPSPPSPVPPTDLRSYARAKDAAKQGQSRARVQPVSPAASRTAHAGRPPENTWLMRDQISTAQRMALRPVRRQQVS